ncbi:MAG: T9SS type A sorting domain-containing protein [Rufibacter sp.]
MELPTEGVKGQHFDVLVQISGTTEYSQGGFNIRFTFDQTAMSTPVIVEAFNFNNEPYTPISLSFSDNRWNINGAIDMSQMGTAVAVEPEWTKVLKLRFKITDPNKTSNLEFLPYSADPAQKGTSIFNHDTGQQLETGRLENLDAPLYYSPLPVTFTNVVAAWQKNNQVLLSWSTASEFNNKEFLVQRCPDGRTFETFAKVNGAGTSQVVNSYSVIDLEPVEGITYYRIKQIDFDGKFEYSKIVNVKATLNVQQSLTHFGPNPFQKEASVTFSSIPNHTVRLTMTDLQGKVIRTERISAVNEKTKYTLKNLEDLKQGVYLVKIEGPGVASAFKVIKE